MNETVPWSPGRRFVYSSFVWSSSTRVPTGVFHDGNSFWADIDQQFDGESVGPK